MSSLLPSVVSFPSLRTLYDVTDSAFHLLKFKQEHIQHCLDTRDIPACILTSHKLLGEIEFSKPAFLVSFTFSSGYSW